MNHYYTDEINTLILISLLKAHNIKKVIASPGTTNISFVGSIQFDPYFEMYSAVDERAAAYMACGLAEESGEPVVLTCTGATASRNYIPGLTEAYYRKLPILAITSSQHQGKTGNNVAQMLDRTSQFNDMVKESIQAFSVYTEEDKQRLVTSVNDAILELNHHAPGPVHINLVTTYSNNFVVAELPSYRVIRRIIDKDFPEMPNGKVGIFIGAHKKFTDEETEVIDSFCETNNAVVICDQISNYRGKYRFLASFANGQVEKVDTKAYDLIIYIGSIHGAYIKFGGNQLWRVNKDGRIRDPYSNLTYVFEMEEIDFFRHYIKENRNNTILSICNDTSKGVINRMPELPFSNMWIAKETASLIPDGSVLHLGILNSLRVWNYFETPQNVLCYSNTGGYGIDGCLSSCIGSAIVNKELEHYLVIGDLSFFYDINCLFNEVPSNIHIMLINNGVGTEFKNYNHRAAYFGEDANKFMAAKGHNGFKSNMLIKELCSSLNIHYYAAHDKASYLDVYSKWLGKGNGPIVLEAFIEDKYESEALRLMNNVIPAPRKIQIKRKIKRAIKKVINI